MNVDAGGQNAHHSTQQTIHPSPKYGNWHSIEQASEREHESKQKENYSYRQLEKGCLGGRQMERKVKMSADKQRGKQCQNSSEDKERLHRKGKSKDNQLEAN